MPPNKIVLVRHATSMRNEAYDSLGKGDSAQWNKLKSIEDPPLSEKGVKQAEATALELQKKDLVSVCFTSPSLRATQTANAFGPTLAIPVFEEPALTEVNLGPLKQFHNDYIDAHYPDLKLSKQRLGEYYYRPPGGESYHDKVENELKPFLDGLLARVHDENVLIVSHSLTVRCLKMLLLGLPPTRFKEATRSPNCAVTTFQRENSVYILENDNLILYPNEYSREKDKKEAKHGFE